LFKKPSPFVAWYVYYSTQQPLVQAHFGLNPFRAGGGVLKKWL